jgi:hypothetical protein
MGAITQAERRTAVKVTVQRVFIMNSSIGMITGKIHALRIILRRRQNIGFIRGMNAGAVNMCKGLFPGPCRSSTTAGIPPSSHRLADGRAYRR